MSNLKKSRVLLYIEFFHSQNLEEFEEKIRKLSSQKKFPPFRNIIVGCDYKNLKRIPNTPMVLPHDED